MPLIRHEGSGRVRMLHNNARMSFKSFQESMQEQFPISKPVSDYAPDFDELVERVDTLKDRLDTFEKKVAPEAALRKAQIQAASGILKTEPKSNTDIQSHQTERDIWD